MALLFKLNLISGIFNLDDIAIPKDLVTIVQKLRSVLFVQYAIRTERTMESGSIDDLRISWDEYFMKHAHLAARRSTCTRIQTGSVLVKDHRIISEGYNGTVSGASHCNTFAWGLYQQMIHDPSTEANQESQSYQEFLKSAAFSAAHHEWSNNNEIHGEQNAILYACRCGTKTKNAYMYTVYGPCLHCAKVLVISGVTRVYFDKFYDRDTQNQGIMFLLKHGIRVFQVTGSKVSEIEHPDA